MGHFEEEDIARVIQDPATRVVAAEVLAQIRATRETDIPAAEGLDAAADFLNRDRGELWVEQLKAKGLLLLFVAALRSRGVATEEYPFDPEAVTIDDGKLRVFLNQVDTFRCKILVGKVVKGSGILVGPSSVLTAWHVISDTESTPKTPNISSKISVELVDGKVIPAVSFPVLSPCGDDEWPPGGGTLPKNDDDVADRHDVALLRLREPVGIRLTYAALASPAYAFRGPADVILVCHPNGQWKGIQVARLQKLRNLTARWGYNVKATAGGSSGGGCFDTKLTLTGIHQGRAANGGRLVPLVRFDSAIRKAITDDVTPEILWSLDGTPDSDLVVGRDAFFKGYHASMQGPERVRGLWVRRVDLQHDVAGLPFSYELLAKLVARSSTTRLIRISFDVVVHDLPTELARRATAAGFNIGAPLTMPGVGLNHTEPEAVIADRSRRLALSLNEMARAQDVRLWVFFDHPSAAFGDDLRWALTAFVDQAMRCEHLRIALAGYEAMQMPVIEFQEAVDAVDVGAPGLMVEYLTDLQASDVENLIVTAAKDLNCPLSPERVRDWIAEALKDLKPVNKRYDSKLRSEIAQRLQPKFKQLRGEVIFP